MKRVAAAMLAALFAMPALASRGPVFVTPIIYDVQVEFVCKAAPQARDFAPLLASEQFRLFEPLGPEGPSGLTARDAHRRLIQLIYGEGDRIMLALNTPPPGAHDAALENRMRAFVERLPGCRVTATTYGDIAFDMEAALRAEGVKERGEICDARARQMYEPKRCAWITKVLRDSAL